MLNSPISSSWADGAKSVWGHDGRAPGRIVRAGGFLLLLGALLAVSHMFLARAVGALVADYIASFAEPAGTASIGHENPGSDRAIVYCAAMDGTSARLTDCGPHRGLPQSPSRTIGAGLTAPVAGEASKKRGCFYGRRPELSKRMGFCPCSAIRICPRHGSFRR